MFKRRVVRIGLAGLVVVAALLAPGAGLGQAAGPARDQSFKSGYGFEAAISKDYTQAQTFTAGRNGTLAGVNLQVLSFGGNARLRVSIRNTDHGVPGQTVLATTLLDPQNYHLTQLITFPEQPRIYSGVRYAIVLSTGSQRGFEWKGATAAYTPPGDAYTRGAACSRSSFTGGAFECTQESDFHFQTWVYSGG